MTERQSGAPDYSQTRSGDTEALGSTRVPAERGRVDTCEGPRVLGWLIPEEGVESRATVELWVNGERCLSEAAVIYRQDLAEGGIGDGRHGFALRVPPVYCDGHSHVCEVREGTSGLPLNGSPIDFVSDEPVVKGSVDSFSEDGIHGWAVHSDGLDLPARLDWSIDGNEELTGTVVADRLRGDLVAHGYGDGHHGFLIEIPDTLPGGLEHFIEVRSVLDGRPLSGSPFPFRLSPLLWWAKSADLDEIGRRKGIERTLDRLDELNPRQLDLSDLRDLTAMETWLASLPRGRLRRRLHETIKRVQTEFFEVEPLVFAGRDRLRSALTDMRGGKENISIDLTEGNRVLSSAVVFEGPRDVGALKELGFVLPSALLEEDIRKLTLRVSPIGLEFGPWSLFTHAPHESPRVSRDIDSICETTAGVQAARRRRHDKASSEPPQVALARIRLEDADLNPNDEHERGTLVRLKLTLAQALLEEGKWDDAVAHFEEVRELDAENIDALAGVIRCLLSQENEIEAELRIESALERAPDESALHVLRDALLCRRRPHSIRILAFYLPQFYAVPENDESGGKGFTDWQDVGGAVPLFWGHLQPRLPTTLGCYDLRLAEAANAQFELARRYGIDGFCYYYYWFEGRRIFERPLDDLVAGRTGPFPFCICWANEDWTRSCDSATGELMLAHSRASGSDLLFIQDVAPLLKHPDYIRVDGKPMLLVYRVDRLATPKETVAAWREWCRAEGFGELYLCAVESFGFYDPRPFGFDAAVELPPHCLRDRYPELGYLKQVEVGGDTKSFQGVAYSFQAFATAAIARRREPFTLHRTAMLAWDNTPKRSQEGVVYQGFATNIFKSWHLSNARRAASEQGQGVCFINAWNDWIEGSVMEPDVLFGYTNLETVRWSQLMMKIDPLSTYWSARHPVVPISRLDASERIILVGHDARPHGAQINMLHMAKCLKRDIGVDLEIMLIHSGELLPEYEKVATTHLVSDRAGWQSTLRSRLRSLWDLGVRKAICNTVVTGDVCELLNQEGFKVVGLLHELPTLIKAYGLESQCWRFAEKTDAIVCASRLVADEFANRYWPDLRRILVSPQGIAFNRYHDAREKMRAVIRKELGLLPSTQIVMGCGYGDIRKGIDLFVQLAAKVLRRHRGGHAAFVWVGALDTAVEPYIKTDVKRLGLEKVFRVTGRTDDPARFFIAGDVFALTSREDPFPSVVMEAFDAHMPVVAFSGGGGYVDIVGEGTGALVPYLDLTAMAESVDYLLCNSEERGAKGQYCHALCRERFGYIPYVRKLLALLADVPAEQVAAGHLQRQGWSVAGRERPRITTIVPNYNYARYLELRLRSIAAQTLPPDEIIVLDDASNDASLAVIEALVARIDIPIKLIINEKNTGNPFVQWARGMEEATGDLVWIAEADDYCEPMLLETLAKELADDNVVMAWSDSVIVDEDGNSQGAQYKDYFARNYGEKWRLHFRMPGRKLVKDCMLIENVVPNASAVLFRKSATSFDFAPIKSFRFSGDWWFWLSMAMQGDVVYRADPLNYHRRHHRSVMGEVLRAGESLLPETMDFYEQIAGRHPDLFSPRAVSRITKRLDDLYGMFPAFLDEQPTLHTHPRFGHQWERLSSVMCLAGGTAMLDAPSILVLSEDAAGTTDAQILVKAALAERGMVVFLSETDIEPQWVSAQFGLDLELLDESRIKVLTAVSEQEPKSLRDPVSGCARIADDLGHLLKEAHGGRVLSYGLLAHAVTARSLGRGALNWTMLGGQDFNVLMGASPKTDLFSIDDLANAVAACTDLAFLGEGAPHVLARIAQNQMRNLDRWMPENS
jgi:glycosyltransferase involved in cell wall biosynthesis